MNHVNDIFYLIEGSRIAANCELDLSCTCAVLTSKFCICRKNTENKLDCSLIAKTVAWMIIKLLLAFCVTMTEKELEE